MAHKIITTIDRNSPLAKKAPSPTAQPRVIIKEVPILIPGPPGPAGPAGPPGNGTERVQSASGAFTVPALVSVGDLVYATGAFTADRASNASLSTAPAIALVQDKPTPTTATLVFMGPLSVFAGLTPMDQLFLGVDGALVLSSGLPGTPGSVRQRVGMVLDATTLLFDPGIVIVRS